MPRKPERGDLHGLLLLAKEAGPSSNQVLQELRRHLGWVKAGHAGTLDPAASGLLLVLLGEAVKLVPYLADLEKEYVGVVRFGAETDTQDAAGARTRTAPWEHLGPERIQAEMATFLGASLQEPPMYSALQVGGRRLYDIARAGEQVVRAARRIEVSMMLLLAWAPPDAEFVVRVSSGTYVRTLARDLGVRCGSAAHLAALSRTAIGPFRLEKALTIADLAALAPGAAPPLVRLADALAHVPAMTLGEREARAVLDGRAPAVHPGELPAGLAHRTTLRLLDGAGRLLAVARLADPGVPVELLRVFREP
jgi:tRNA pseudouridine55 synthase